MAEKEGQKANSQNVQKVVEIDCSDVKVFEDFNTGLTNKIPRLRFFIVPIKKNGFFF